MPSSGPARRESRPRGELAAALAGTALVAGLAADRMLHAGGLWRDEAGAARLATLPTLGEALRHFPHEAFPPLFVVTVRAYSQLTGGGDLALRAFGLAVGLALAAVLWWSAWSTARATPLLSLALVGLAPPFFVYGDSLRGYGLGSVAIVLTYGLLAGCLARAELPAGEDDGLPLPALLLATALAAVASVQLVLGNAALVLALCAAGAALAARRRRPRLALAILGCGAAAALSLLPYAAQLGDADRRWNAILVYPVTAARLVSGFAAAVGSRPVALVWLGLAGVGLAGLGRERIRRRRTAEERERADGAAFAALTLALAVAASAAFQKSLGYTPRPWYFLPLAALLAAALETLFARLVRSPHGRRLAAVRLGAVALLAAAQLAPLYRTLDRRQTQADLVARRVARAAGRGDLVVVIPWYYGVSFDRYYRGAAPWLTLPEIADHRFHRYDLLRRRLASPHPIDDLLRSVAATLRAGHRVFLVGRSRWPRPGEALAVRPPAPLSPAGWNDDPYILDWSRQLGAFLESHAGAVTPAPPLPSSANGIEDMPLVVVEGWRPPARPTPGIPGVGFPPIG